MSVHKNVKAIHGSTLLVAKNRIDRLINNEMIISVSPNLCVVLCLAINCAISPCLFAELLATLL